MELKDVLKRGYAKEIYEYALKHKNIDAEILTDELLKSHQMPTEYKYDSSWYLDTEDNWDSDDDWDYEGEVVFEDEPVEWYYYLFARDIEGANIPLIEEHLWDSFYNEYKILFARDVKGANIELLGEGMEGAWPSELYKFATTVKGVDVGVIESHLIGNLESCYDSSVRDEFIMYVPKFIEDVEGVDVGNIINSIKEYINNNKNKGFYIEMLQELVNELEEKQKVKSKGSKKTLM